MGLLRRLNKYFIVFLFINGCASSLIKVDTLKDGNPVLQYGGISYRNFIYKQTVNGTITEKWEAEINGGFSNSSVTIYDSAVFVNDLSGRIYCFSLATGKTLGQLKFKGSIFTAPVIYKSLIIFVVASDQENISTFYIYDYKIGKELSSVEIKGRITNQLLQIDDGIILLAETGHLYKYDYKGNLIWQYETKSFCHSSPASNDKVIFWGNDDGEVISIDDYNGKLFYRKKIADSFFSGAVVYDNEVFAGNDDGNLYSIDLNSGNVNWYFKTGAKIKMEAVVTEDEIFIGNLRGELYKLSRDGKQIWKMNTEGLLNVTPILTNEYLILPDANKKVYFISRDTGEIVNSITLDGRVKLSPVINKNLLFIGYENGNLKAYDITQH
jgi:outer membrane protein assembly factor BamB